MANIICPFCLKPHSFKSSLQCETVPEESVPSVYVKDYRKVPPLWLLTIGFSHHGKTTYLAALTWMFEKLGKVWEDVSYLPLDQQSMEAIQTMRKAAKKLTVIEKTKGSPRPLLLNVNELPNFGSRCLIMYDVAGETCNSMNELLHLAPAIKQVNTIWFIVSLRDLQKEEEGKSLPDLFYAYIKAMDKFGIKLAGRNLIVVYTKGDTDAYDGVFDNYLRSDPFRCLTYSPSTMDDFSNYSLEKYLAEMKTASDVFEDYTRKNIDGGATFINVVKKYKMNLVFCITSALGEDPLPSGELSSEPHPTRVLDPFLWALSLEKANATREIGLIFDSTIFNNLQNNDKLLFDIWEELSNYGEVTTYNVGFIKSVGQPQQQFDSKLLQPNLPNLIGPILEQADPGTHFIVMTAGNVLDLNDFVYSPWQKQLFIVSFNENETMNWPNFVTFKSEDSLQTIITKFLHLYEEENN